MSGVSMTAVFDDGPIRKHLAMLAIADARGFDNARRNIGEFFVAQVQDNLRDQKLFDGSAMPQSEAAKGRSTYWKGNRAAKGDKPAHRKGEMREAGKTLIDRGRLRDSYTYGLTRLGLEVGSALKYAAIHHFGGETGRPGHRFNMTARPVLGMNAELESAIGQFLIDEIKKAQR